MRVVLILAAIGLVGWAPQALVAVASWALIGYLVWRAWPGIVEDWQRLGRRRRRKAGFRGGRYSADRHGSL